jgi:hypothetical protein
MTSKLQLALSKVEPEPNSGCWLWAASVNAAGYGQFSIPAQRDGIWKNKTHRAHKYLYEQLVGPVPAGLDLDHKCRVRSCVNPDHLEPVTRSENVRRGLSPIQLRARHQARTHCIHGHPLSGENVHHLKRGERVCRACSRIRTAKWSAKENSRGQKAQTDQA